MTTFEAMSVATPIVCGLFGWLIKRAVSGNDKRLDTHEAWIQELRQDSVSKEEWIREAGYLRKSMDEVSKGIANLQGRQDQSVDIAAAIAAALNAQREKR